MKKRTYAKWFPSLLSKTMIGETSLLDIVSGLETNLKHYQKRLRQLIILRAEQGKNLDLPNEIFVQEGLNKEQKSEIVLAIMENRIIVGQKLPRLPIPYPFKTKGVNPHPVANIHFPKDVLPK